MSTRRDLILQRRRIQQIRRDAVPLPKRIRAKLRRRLKKHFGLNRRQMGAIGAGHLVVPKYAITRDAYFEQERFRRLGG